jgi:hypothetical protein
MQVRYPRYECSHSRADHVATPLCGSVRAAELAADRALVRGKRTVLEDLVPEKVRGRSGHHQPGVVEGLAERDDPLIPFRGRHVEVEHVGSLPAHRADPEREAISRAGTYASKVMPSPWLL